MSFFRVDLKKVVDESYDVETGYDLYEKLKKDLQNGLVGDIKKFAVITDDNVRKLYGEKICKLLVNMGYSAALISFPPGESNKTRATKEYLEDTMMEAGYRRDCCIVAVGGGVVTDLAGFVAGTFGRGIPFINYVTTLLAAADAAIGGKTAVDTELATNMIGMFNQPEKVYLDIAAWKSLPAEQISNGLAETIKHACIRDKDFFYYISENMEKIFDIDEGVCNHIAEMNCRIKAQIVMEDEKEKNLRQVLNLGHTLGRAIETVSKYRLLHGQAVAIGLMAEIKISKRLGFSDDNDEALMRELLDAAKLPTTIPDYIDREALVQKLYTDKKTRNNQLHFVLQNGIGKIKISNTGEYSHTIPESLVREIITNM